MRIAGGELRGRPIRAPEGTDTRPTSDRARQAVFNILEHAAWSPGVADLGVLDLFAGSGAMGLEALSRGAGRCLFVEREEAALAAIRENITAFKVGARAKVLKRNIAKLGPRLAPDTPYDLAFLDPPYARGLGETALAELAAGGWLAEGAVVVLERGSGEADLAAGGFELLDERRYGAAKVSFLRLG